MFNLGDRVQHKQNGQVGKVVGYGHQIVEGYYLTTVEVQIFTRVGIKPIIEDLFSEWVPWQELINSQSSNLLTNSRV